MSGSVSNNKIKAAFIAGNLTCAVIVLIAGLFVGYRIGFGRIADRARSVLFSQSPRQVDCPDAVLAELTTIGAVIENAGNPTQAKEHDSIMVEPDQDFIYRLRNNAKVAGFVLRAINGANFDPPVLYMNADAELSSSARQWIQQQSRNQFVYTTTSSGMRTTLPTTDATRRCLFVGDSVCFGVGVDDADTIASIVQTALGPEITVLNAGVGGYDGQQAFRKAQQLADQDQFESLVYVACDNDFNEEPPAQVIQRFARIKDRFSNGVCVLYTPYLEYTKGDLLYGGGGNESWNQKGEQRRAGCRAACQESDLSFIDFNDVIDSYQAQRQTIFAGLELFADHCHFSKAGNRLAAQSLLSRLYPNDQQQVSIK